MGGDGDEAGYAYTFDRQMYINRQTKKAFSVENVFLARPWLGQCVPSKTDCAKSILNCFQTFDATANRSLGKGLRAVLPTAEAPRHFGRLL
jgi:hypothetical protein